MVPLHCADVRGYCHEGQNEDSQRGVICSGRHEALDRIGFAGYAIDNPSHGRNSRQQCAAKGFDAVEPDIGDSYTDNNGFGITEAQNAAYDNTLGTYTPGAGNVW